MSARQHTPGPWVIDDRPLYDDAAGMNAKPIQRGACIATVETAFGWHSIHATATIGQPCPSTAELDAQGLANANLISAAPELLAELIDLGAELERQLNDPAATVEEGFPVAERIRAAIAKAEGRS